MAKTRECDRHGGTFSEREEGWAEGNFVIHRRYADGSPNEERIPVDFCPACVSDMISPPKRTTEPNPLVPALTAPTGYDPEYTRYLEEKNHVGNVFQQTLDDTGITP